MLHYNTGIHQFWTFEDFLRREGFDEIAKEVYTEMVNVNNICYLPNRFRADPCKHCKKHSEHDTLCPKRRT